MLFKKGFLQGVGFLYRNILKRILFKIDAEKVHVQMVKFGESLGRNKTVNRFISSQFKVKDNVLKQKIAEINFENPIGLSAGFDYEARLTQILPSVGFGFETIGTITDLACSGNPSPQLGRLPKSKSLMVNKGFRNLGAKATCKKLEDLSFDIPIGISIGKSNLPQINTEKKAIKDILNTFTIFEKSKAKLSYYELNISCPNLHGNVSFYSLKNLKELLTEVDKLQIKKPIFVKMPLEKENKEMIELMETISKYSPKGIILSNLSKNRKNPFLDKQEVEKFPTGIGAFSGKPTYERSNELIKLAYKNFKNRFIVIGSGGVFSGQDAYEKITSGASLVQLITGMIFQGPQLISQINLDLISLLKKDRFTNVTQAIGQNC